MRALEFTINIQINIKINDSCEPEVYMCNQHKEPAKDPSELDPNPVFMSPLQQEIELKKADQGKDSPIIKDLTQDETEHDPSNPIYRK